MHGAVLCSTSAELLLYREQQFDVVFHVHPCVTQVLDVVINVDTPTVKGVDHVVRPIRTLDEISLDSKVDTPGILQLYKKIEGTRKRKRVFLSNTLHDYTDSIDRFGMPSVEGLQVKGFSELFVGDAHVPRFYVLKCRDPFVFRHYKELQLDGAEACVFVSRCDNFRDLLIATQKDPRAVLQQLLDPDELLFVYSDDHYTPRVLSVADLRSPSSRDKEIMLHAGRDNALCVVNRCFVYTPFLQSAEVVFNFKCSDLSPLPPYSWWHHSFKYTPDTYLGFWLAPCGSVDLNTLYQEEPPEEAADVIADFVIENIDLLTWEVPTGAYYTKGHRYIACYDFDGLVCNLSLENHAPSAGPFILFVLLNDEFCSYLIVPGSCSINTVTDVWVNWRKYSKIETDGLKFSVPLMLPPGCSSITVIAVGVANLFYAERFANCSPFFGFPEVLVRTQTDEIYLNTKSSHAFVDPFVPALKGSLLERTQRAVRPEQSYLSDDMVFYSVVHEWSDRTIHYLLATQAELQYGLFSKAPLFVAADHVQVTRGVVLEGRLSGVITGFSYLSADISFPLDRATFAAAMRGEYTNTTSTGSGGVTLGSVFSEVRLSLVYNTTVYADTLNFIFTLTQEDPSAEVYLDVILYKDPQRMQTYNSKSLSDLLLSVEGGELTESGGIRYGLRIKLSPSATKVCIRFREALPVCSAIVRWIQFGSDDRFTVTLFSCVASVVFTHLFSVLTSDGYVPLSLDALGSATPVYTDDISKYVPTVFKWDKLPADIKYFSSLVLLGDRVSSAVSTQDVVVYEVSQEQNNAGICYISVPFEVLYRTSYKAVECSRQQVLPFCKVLIRTEDNKTIAYTSTEGFEIRVTGRIASSILKSLIEEGKTPWIEMNVPNFGWHTYRATAWEVHYRTEYAPTSYTVDASECCGVASSGENVVHLEYWDTTKIRVEFPLVSGVHHIRSNDVANFSFTLEPVREDFDMTEFGELVEHNLYAVHHKVHYTVNGTTALDTGVIAVQVPAQSKLFRVCLVSCSYDEANMTALHVPPYIVYGEWVGQLAEVNKLDLSAVQSLVCDSPTAVVDAESHNCVGELVHTASGTYLVCSSEYIGKHKKLYLIAGVHSQQRDSSEQLVESVQIDFKPAPMCVPALNRYRTTSYKILEPIVLHKYAGTQESITEDVRAITED